MEGFQFILVVIGLVWVGLTIVQKKLQQREEDRNVRRRRETERALRARRRARSENVTFRPDRRETRGAGARSDRPRRARESDDRNRRYAATSAGDAPREDLLGDAPEDWDSGFLSSMLDRAAEAADRAARKNAPDVTAGSIGAAELATSLPDWPSSPPNGGRQGHELTDPDIDDETALRPPPQPEPVDPALPDDPVALPDDPVAPPDDPVALPAEEHEPAPAPSEYRFSTYEPSSYGAAPAAESQGPVEPIASPSGSSTASSDFSVGDVYTPSSVYTSSYSVYPSDVPEKSDDGADGDSDDGPESEPVT